MKVIFLLTILALLTFWLFYPKKATPVSAALEEELCQTPLVVRGTLPTWLSGTLIRNGPVTVTVDGKQNTHWFDGLAMLHAFSFKEGSITYTNKFLRTEAYTQVFEKGSLNYDSFAADPCRSLFKRFLTFLIPHSGNELPNANINVAKLADTYVALTETPLPVRFDPYTLKTLGVLDYQDKLPHKNCWESAHPHYNQSLKENLNYLIVYGRHSHYTLYTINESTRARQIIAKIPVDEPSYMHSFAVTENYIILTEYPFTVKPLDLMLKGQAFIKNFHWHPERGSQFSVVERKSGRLVGKYPTKAFFAFHHANAYEANNSIYLDIVTYPDAAVIMGLADHARENIPKTPIHPHLERFCLSLHTGEISSTTLLEKAVEFPRIHDAYDGKPYTYVYLINPQAPENSPDEKKGPPIYKINTQTKETLQWAEPGCYPGEPVFVSSPQPQTEDEGVILSIIFDHAHHSSFLLVLDAQTFQEVARAEVTHVIPAGLHGHYFAEVSR